MSEIITVGLDLAKNVFQVHGAVLHHCCNPPLGFVDVRI